MTTTSPLYRDDDPLVVPPRLIDQPKPTYPPQARRRGQQARVVVGVLVDSTGRITQAILKVRDGTEVGFDEAALEAAYRARFEPARRDGVPGRMWTELPFEFRLE